MSKDIELYDADKFSLKSRSDGNYFVNPEFEIIPREEWRAERPRDPGEPMGTDVGVIVATLNTDTPPCDNAEDCERTVRRIQRNHLLAGHPDIQYNFLIGSDRRIYEGRGWFRKSCPSLATPEGFPLGEKRIDIAYIGDWRFVENPAIEMADPSIFLVMFGVCQDFIRDHYKFLEIDKRYVKKTKASPLDG